MTHVRIDVLQRAAQQGGYALPHLLGGTIEMVVAQIKAAEDCDSPLALGFAPEVFPMVPLEHSLPMIVNAAQRARVPIATQLEHGRDFDTIMHAIRLGVSSVMFDGSELPFEENIAQTREIVRVAHAFGVAVEGELGCVGGSAVTTTEGKESLFTEPEQVVEFVARTGVDTLAISFGNVHGRYRGQPCLDLERVHRISTLVDIPLVMHGGSGLSAEDYRRVVESGISNIHFYTAIASGVWPHLNKMAGAAQAMPLYHEMVGWTVDHFYHEAVHVIEMLGSTGRASTL
ncbi:MAG: class II fructose-bisphosphate aldolase [Anaerolineae bacterium]